MILFGTVKTFFFALTSKVRLFLSAHTQIQLHLGRQLRRYLLCKSARTMRSSLNELLSINI